MITYNKDKLAKSLDNFIQSREDMLNFLVKHHKDNVEGIIIDMLDDVIDVWVESDEDEMALENDDISISEDNEKDNKEVGVWVAGMIVDGTGYWDKNGDWHTV